MTLDIKQFTPEYLAENYADAIRQVRDEFPEALKDLPELPTGKRGTVKQWFQGNDSKRARCLVIDQYKVWSPAARTINAKVFASRALLEGSSIDYSPSTVLRSNEDVLVFINGYVLFMYWIASPFMYW